jgi:release factor glutamine methyltransferase
MTVSEFKDYFHKELSDIYPTEEIRSFFAYAMEAYLGFKPVDWFTRPNHWIPSKEFSKLFQAVDRLKQEEPIQYIIGVTEFYGFPFFVDENVLIPRPETEELVEWILDEVAKSESRKVTESLKILDIGTGSGCIPISLKRKIPSATISAIDVSEKALETAQKNADLHEVHINFMQKNILEVDHLDQTYDIIVSNPPYVRALDKAEMQNNVLNYEPELALFVEDDDPLIFYRKIAQLAKDHLNENGVLFFEINQYLGKETVELLRLFGFQEVLLKKDLFGKDRMIQASF